MAYKIELIRKEQLQTQSWSGGTTTQLAIYPKDAMYSERNFIWRLSSAKVEVDQSEFTSLPNINRIIMVIEGELTLDHEGHHKSTLKPFDQDHFEGSWITRSSGKVRDFNLMMGEGCEGRVESMHLIKGQLSTISLSNKKDEDRKISEMVQGIYCVKGKVKMLVSDEKKITLHEGDMALLSSKDFGDRVLEIYNEEEKADLISVWIRVEAK